MHADLQQDADGYYLIGTAADLVEFSALSNVDAGRAANVRLTADIDMSSVENFTPIGKHIDLDLVQGFSVRDWDYRGTFDGQGHIISNLKIDCADGSEAGLFSRLIDAKIKNLGIVNATVKNGGAVRAGVLAAIIIRGQVSNCFTMGKLEVETDSPNKSGFVGTYLQNFGAAGLPLISCFTTDAALYGEAQGDVSNCFTG